MDPAGLPIPPVARALLITTGILWLVLEIRQGAQRRPEGVRVEGGGVFVVRIAIVVGVLVAIVASRDAPGATFGSLTAAAWIGLGLLWCGVTLRLWSFRTLGRYFTFTVVTSPDQPVITDGPYRFVRHPGYAGVLVAVVGLGLFTGNWLALVGLTACVTAGLVYRIRVEERALLNDLGDSYRRYAATHKRLVPFLW